MSRKADDEVCAAPYNQTTGRTDTGFQNASFLGVQWWCDAHADDEFSCRRLSALALYHGETHLALTPSRNARMRTTSTGR